MATHADGRQQHERRVDGRAFSSRKKPQLLGGLAWLYAARRSVHLGRAEVHVRTPSKEVTGEKRDEPPRFDVRTEARNRRCTHTSRE